MHEVIMPKLGLTMESGKIEKWHKKEGDSVDVGDVLFEVMTDKVSLEVESYNSGILRKILKWEGEDVPVTEIVAYIGTSDEKIPSDNKTSESVKSFNNPTSSIKEIEHQNKKVIIEPANKNVEDKQKIRISPLAKKIAQDNGINFNKISGTGPGGRIIKEDILAFKETLRTKESGIRNIEDRPEKEITVKDIKVDNVTNVRIESSSPLKGIRKLIAERMSFSVKNSPHIWSKVVPDVGELVTLREGIKDKFSSIYKTKITMTDFIIKIVAMTLSEQPIINSSCQDNNHIIYDEINIGIAVAIDEGLVVPTIYNANKLSIHEIAKKRSQLVEKARNNNLNHDEISNGTFTISNLGMFGIRSLMPIINPPQAAILGIGEIYTAPAFVGEKIEPRSYMEVSITADHRILDGAVAARFLKRIVEIIEDPKLLFL